MNFTIILDENQLNVVSAALIELPYKTSAPIMAALQLQINEQIAKVATPLPGSNPEGQANKAGGGDNG